MECLIADTFLEVRLSFNAASQQDSAFNILTGLVDQILCTLENFLQLLSGWERLRPYLDGSQIICWSVGIELLLKHVACYSNIMNDTFLCFLYKLVLNSLSYTITPVHALVDLKDLSGLGKVCQCLNLQGIHISTLLRGSSAFIIESVWMFLNHGELVSSDSLHSVLTCLEISTIEIY